MRGLYYQNTFGCSIVATYVFLALFFHNSRLLDGLQNGEWGTLFDHYGKNLERVKVHRGDVLQKSNDDLILIYDNMRIFKMEHIEPSPGQYVTRCHLYGYPKKEDDWPVLLTKTRRANNLGVTLALAFRFTEKYLPFDPVHCNRRHYMDYILYGEIARSKEFLACPLAAPLTGVTVDQIKNSLLKLMDSDGKLHDFVEYALPKEYKWPEWAAVQEGAAITERRRSCKRMVRHIFAFIGSAKRPKSSEKILKRVKIKACKGRPALQYRIQLVDKYTVYEAALFMEKHYPHGENVVEAMVCEQDDDMNEQTESSQWIESLAKGFSLAAFLEDKQGNRGPIIGCNVLDLTEKDSQETKDDSKETEKVTNSETKIPECRRYILFQTVEDLKSKVDVFTLYKCSSYVTGAGMAVDEDHRGRGIATELIRARDKVCRMLNVPVDATIFNGVASQRAAEKCGYKTISELDLRTYKINGKVFYPNPKTPVIKFMAKRYY